MTNNIPISEILEDDLDPEMVEMVRKGLGLLKEKKWKDARAQFGRIGRQFARHGRWGEAAYLNEFLATKQTRWEETIWYMRRAIVWYNRADEMEACVRCHRRMREIVPKNLSPRRLLDIWRPAGVVIAYPHIGAADEAASQLRTLGRAVIEWPIWERFQYHLALSNIYRELKEWDKVVQEGRQFATWARAIPENDPALLYKNVSFDGEVSDELTSELGRWFCICEMLALVIIKSEVQAGIDSLRTFSDLEQSLGKFEQHQLEAERRAYDNPNDPSFRTTADQFNSRLGGCFGLAGWAAYEAGKCEEALQYLSREEELTGSLRASGPFYRTAALLALDRIEEAKECLSKISGKCTTNGDARRYIEQIKEFEKVREDPDFIKITQEWR